MNNSRLFRTSQTLAMPLALTLLATCATSTPAELNNARVAYTRASSGPAAEIAPADLHKARVALDLAEQSFIDEKGSQKTVDLSYIAERTSQIAEAHAVTALAQKSESQAKQEYGDKQAEMAKKTLGTLADTREQLSQAEKGKALQAQQTAAERSAREESDRKAAASEQKAAEADQKAKDANDALAKLAAKEEERGMVITLSGSVLFRSNDSMLLPAAQTRLDQVAEALVAKGQNVVVEGYTDSRGSQATNMSLSQRRADSVRTYLVTRGFPSDKIQAQGMGPDRPVADNTSAEGRANNRRVEIVISRAQAPRVN